MKRTSKTSRTSFSLRFVLPILLGLSGHSSTAMAQSAGTFTATGSMATARSSHTATLLTNGIVLMAGGVTVGLQNKFLASAELYDPSTGAFAATGEMATSRGNHTSTLLPNGKVLIAGGDVNDDNHGHPVASAELYDPSTGTFTVTADMSATRAGHTATPLNNGKVLIAGGVTCDLGGNCLCCFYSNHAELYDPSTGTFTATGSMTAARAGQKATLLNNGKVLMDGGSNDTLAEVYDPDTGAFSLSGATTYAPYYLSTTSASVLTNGEVLITLDDGCAPGDLAEVYDPSTGAFSATGNMTAARYDSTATLLPDGTVLIAARGYWPIGVAGAELYDLATGTFRATGSPITARDGHTATLLPDGTVLIGGGWASPGPMCCAYSIATAEIYHPAVLVPSPVLFSLSQDGRGQGAIWHAKTGQIASAGNPAVAGEPLSMYTKGLADLSAIPPQLAVGGGLAEILFFGDAPGYPGFSQVNFRVRSGTTPGGAVPVRLTYLGRPSNEVTMGVQ